MMERRSIKENAGFDGMGSPPWLCQSGLISEARGHGVSSHSNSLGGLVERLVDRFHYTPWATIAGVSGSHDRPLRGRLMPRAPLYTQEERRRRDASPWTMVQGVLAPIQFGVFLASLGLVITYLHTGDGLLAATWSIVIKTLVLYAIMVTGSIWERDVFGQYLFARPFFWEDVVSIGVLTLHTGYLCLLAVGAPVPLQLTVALLAYSAYLVNAAQYLVKLRAARLQRPGLADRPVGQML